MEPWLKAVIVQRGYGIVKNTWQLKREKRSIKWQYSKAEAAYNMAERLRIDGATAERREVQQAMEGGPVALTAEEAAVAAATAVEEAAAQASSSNTSAETAAMLDGLLGARPDAAPTDRPLRPRELLHQSMTYDLGEARWTIPKLQRELKLRNYLAEDGGRDEDLILALASPPAEDRDLVKIELKTSAAAFITGGNRLELVQRVMSVLAAEAAVSQDGLDEDARLGGEPRSSRGSSGGEPWTDDEDES